MAMYLGIVVPNEDVYSDGLEVYCLHWSRSFSDALWRLILISSQDLALFPGNPR